MIVVESRMDSRPARVTDGEADVRISARKKFPSDRCEHDSICRIAVMKSSFAAETDFFLSRPASCNHSEGHASGWFLSQRDSRSAALRPRRVISYALSA